MFTSCSHSSETGNLPLIPFIKENRHPATGKGTDTSKKPSMGSWHSVIFVTSWELGRAATPQATWDGTHTAVPERYMSKDDISRSCLQWIISALMCCHQSASRETGQFNWIAVNEGVLHVHPGLILHSSKWECCHRISDLKVLIHAKNKDTVKIVYWTSNTAPQTWPLFHYP